MNFSRLMKAMALVALVSFGGRVLADSLGGDDFEGYNEGAFLGQEGAKWTVDAEDESVISTVFVTELPESVWAEFGEDEYSQVLELNTNGKDLSYDVGSTEAYTVLIDTLVKMVGSDTAPTIEEDNLVQTAVYLNTEDGKLHAWSSVRDNGGYVNDWTVLDDVQVEDGEWVSLKIVVDYTTGIIEMDQNALATVYVNGLAAGEPFVVANKGNAWSKRNVTSVSFRGTGMVDNFTVSEEAVQLQYTTFVTEWVDEDGVVIESNAPGVEYPINGTYVREFWAIDGKPQYEYVSARLLDSDRDVIDTFEGDLVELTVDDDEILLDKTYYVQGIYKVIVNTVTVIYDGLNAPETDYVPVSYGENFELDLNDIVADLEAVEFTYGGNFGEYDDLVDGFIIIEDVTADLTVTVVATFFGDDPGPQDLPIEFDSEGANLVFGSIAFGEDNLKIEFTAAGTVIAEEAFDMGVIVKEDLADTEPYVINATVDASSAQGVIEGEILIDIEALGSFDQLFFFGLTDPTPILGDPEG